MSSKVINWILTLCIVGIISIFSNWIGYNVMPLEALPGILALMGVALLGLVLRDIVPLNIPSIAYIGIIGLIITIPCLLYTSPSPRDS